MPEDQKDTAKTAEGYDSQLFQMDFQGCVMCGDSGVASFFIDSEALKSGHFQSPV